MEGPPLVDTGALRSRLLQRLRGSDFLRDSALVFASSMLANVFAFAFHALVSRSLGVQSYGALFALMAVLPIIGVPVVIISTTLTKYAAEFQVLGDTPHLRALLTRVGVAIIVVGGAVVGLSVLVRVPLAAFLHVPENAIIPTGFLVAVAIALSPLRAMLQGVQDFRSFGISSVIEGAFKAGAGFLFVAVGFGVAGAVFGYALGSGVSVAYTWFVLDRRYRGPAANKLKFDVRRLSQTISGAFILVVTLTLLSNADALLVKHFMSPTQSGLYAAASLGGKILFFGVSFVPMVLLPKATAARLDPRGPLRSLMAAAGMWAIISAGGLLLFYFAPGLVIRSLTGSGFLAATHLLFLYAIAMVFLGGMSIIGNYKIALHRLDFIAPFALATIGEIAAITLHHPTLESVIYVLVCGNAAAFGMGLYGITKWKHDPRESRQEA